MAYFDFDVTLSITHTETIEADSLDDARRIMEGLFESFDYLSDKIEELTTDYSSFDSDHLTFDCLCKSDVNASDSWVTLSNYEIKDYLEG